MLSVRRALLPNLRNPNPLVSLLASHFSTDDADGCQSWRFKMFDRDLKRKQRDRAAWLGRGKGELVDSVAENLLDRLEDCKRTFRNALGGSSEAIKHLLRGLALVWNIEDLMPPSERYVFNFNSKEELKRWHLYSDSEYGGLSSASLEITDSGSGFSGIFSGNLSLDVTEGSTWRINRSGFCGMRSKKFDGFIDLDAYDTLALRIQGDGRCYISTIYTENWINSPGQQEDNSWQAFVFAPKDQWHIVKIPIEHYLPTWRGNVIDAKLEMNPARILGMSLSVNAECGVPGAKSGPGDFRLDIDWIKALRTY